MTKYTVDQIADAAKKACYYVTSGGDWLRMQYCDMSDGFFMTMDEESGEGYKFTFDELVDEDIHFEELTRVVI